MTWHYITLHLKKHDMTSIFEHALFAWHDVTFHNLIKWLTCSFETVYKQMCNVDTLANKFEIQFLVVIPNWHVVTNIMWYSNLVWFGWLSAPVGETGPALPPAKTWGSSQPSKTNAAKTQLLKEKKKWRKIKAEQQREAPCQHWGQKGTRDRERKDWGTAKGPEPADSKPGAKKIDNQESGGIKRKATPDTGSKRAKAKPNNKEPQQKK